MNLTIGLQASHTLHMILLCAFLFMGRIMLYAYSVFLGLIVHPTAIFYKL
jgi:hypothetical protein